MSFSLFFQTLLCLFLFSSITIYIYLISVLTYYYYYCYIIYSDKTGKRVVASTHYFKGSQGRSVGNQCPKSRLLLYCYCNYSRTKMLNNLTDAQDCKSTMDDWMHNLGRLVKLKRFGIRLKSKQVNKAKAKGFWRRNDYNRSCMDNWKAGHNSRFHNRQSGRKPREVAYKV